MAAASAAAATPLPAPLSAPAPPEPQSAASDAVDRVFFQDGVPQMPDGVDIYMHNDSKLPIKTHVWHGDFMRLFDTRLEVLDSPELIRDLKYGTGVARLYLLVHKRSVVGAAYVQFARPPDTDLSVPLIRGYAVVEALEGKGYSQLLLNHVLTEFKDDDFIVADAEQENVRSIKAMRRAAEAVGREFTAVGVIVDNELEFQDELPEDHAACVEWCMAKGGLKLKVVADKRKAERGTHETGAAVGKRGGQHMDRAPKKRKRPGKKRGTPGRWL